MPDTIQRGKNEIELVTDNLGLDDSIGQMANGIMSNARSKDILGGRSVETWADASILIACKMNSVPMTASKIVTVGRANGKSDRDINRAQRTFMKELNLPVKPYGPEDYVGDYAEKLSRSDAVVELATEVLSVVADLNPNAVAGKPPSKVATGALYIATRMMGETNVGQKEIANVSNTSEVTIRKRYRDLLEVITENEVTFDQGDHEELQKMITRMEKDKAERDKYIGSDKKESTGETEADD